MTKFLSAVSVILVLTLLCFCGYSQKGKPELEHGGLSAEIIEIDLDSQVILVKSTDQDGRLGDSCILDCSYATERGNIIYCDYNTGNVKEISLSDLQAGDRIILLIYDSELNKAPSDIVKINQLQLGTQRM